MHDRARGSASNTLHGNRDWHADNDLLSQVSWDHRSWHRNKASLDGRNLGVAVNCAVNNVRRRLMVDGRWCENDRRKLGVMAVATRMEIRVADLEIKVNVHGLRDKQIEVEQRKEFHLQCVQLRQRNAANPAVKLVVVVAVVIEFGGAHDTRQ